MEYAKRQNQESGGVFQLLKNRPRGNRKRPRRNPRTILKKRKFFRNISALTLLFHPTFKGWAEKVKRGLTPDGTGSDLQNHRPRDMGFKSPRLHQLLSLPSSQRTK